LFLQRLLRERQENRELHVYDSFAGLPNKTQEDRSPVGEQFKAGELSASKSVFISHFKHAGLPLPTIHKAWFDQLTERDMPETIAFAFLDGDFYTSIKTSLHLIEKKLSKGAVVIVDDYQAEALPGAARAVHEWLSSRPHLQIRPAHSLAIITGL
jgi:O-methyltransferase